MDFELTLPNGSSGDSLLLVRLPLEGRTVAFDAGDARRVRQDDVLRMDHLMVTHCHVDHFVGFDALVRPRVCREEQLAVHGPEGFRSRVAARLGGYTWNLVDGNHFVVTAREILPGRIGVARFDSGHGFEREDLPDEPLDGALAHSAPGLAIETVTLDHHVASQGWAVQRPRRWSVDVEALQRTGLAPGPWLGALKRSAEAGASVPIEVPGGGTRDSAELARSLLVAERGARVAYVTDTICDAVTRPRIVALAAGADVLACGTPFLDSEAERARLTRHLTASQAGAMAAEAGVATLLLFHASVRYGGGVSRHVEEAQAAAGAGVHVEVQEPDPIIG